MLNLFRKKIGNMDLTYYKDNRVVFDKSICQHKIEPTGNNGFQPKYICSICGRSLLGRVDDNRMWFKYFDYMIVQPSRNDS